MTGRRRDVLEAAAGELGADGKRVLIVPADISVPEMVRELFKRVVAHFGRLDLLVNNAGMSAPAFGALHRHQRCDRRTYQIDRARRTTVQHRLRPDRHRQRSDGYDAEDGDGARRRWSEKPT